jgi:hypothetical protein
MSLKKVSAKDCVSQKADKTLNTTFLNKILLESIFYNGTMRFKKCKQLFEHQHLLLLRDMWW